MQFGLHIADFTFDSGPAELGPTLARHVKHAEDAGIQRITVMDHFWQLPGIGPVEHEMLEAYATLGFLAAHTQKAMLHVLVTGVIYRHPALLAKQVSTLNVLSGGRVGLGIGAGWNEQECVGLGFPFSPVAQRFRTLTSPQNVTKPMLMIGGGGEKKTLKLVAQYADACNLSALAGVPTRKLDVLRAHCDDVGRDYDTVEKTAMIGVNPESTVDGVADQVRALGEAGFTTTYVFSVGIRQPEKVVDLIAGVAAQV